MPWLFHKIDLYVKMSHNAQGEQSTISVQTKSSFLCLFSLVSFIIWYQLPLFWALLFVYINDLYPLLVSPVLAHTLLRYQEHSIVWQIEDQNWTKK